MRTTIRRIGLTLPLATAVAALLYACGKTQEPPTRDPRVLGGTPEGAPVGLATVDTGILQDQTQYRPASFGGAGPADAGASAAAAGADAAAAARELVTNLLNDIESGEVELVLRALEPDQIEPLAADTEFLHRTYELFERLVRGLRQAEGEATAEKLSSGLRRRFAEALKIDPVDADSVTVSPNPLLVVFGPAKTPPVLTVRRHEDRWRVWLEAPLTADDVAAIRAYHEQLQKSLGALIEAMESGTLKESGALVAALVKAALGLELELPGPQEEKPVDQQPEPAGSPEEPP